MDRDDKDPIFMDDMGRELLCFDTCDQYLDGCRGCAKLKQYGGFSEKTAAI